MRQLVKSFLGRTVPLDCYMAVNAYVAARDIRSGRRWESELDLLPRFVHSGDTVVDIGGNHGLYSFHLSRLVGPLVLSHPGHAVRRILDPPVSTYFWPN